MTTEIRRSVVTAIYKIFSDLLTINFDIINYSGISIPIDEEVNTLIYAYPDLQQPTRY